MSASVFPALYFMLCISRVAITVGYKACLIYTYNTECLRNISIVVMCESQNIQRFVLVWIAAKRADADMSLMLMLISQNRLGTPLPKLSHKCFGHYEN